MTDVSEIKKRIDLLDLVSRDTTLKRVASTGGGEWAGACPFCGGRDRFRVQPERGLWWCRQCSGEHWQDAIAYVMRRDGLDFRAAIRAAIAALGGGVWPASHFVPARPASIEGSCSASNSEQWQVKARALIRWAQGNLWAEVGQVALEYLRGRGLCDETIRAAGLGYNPRDRFRRPDEWGLNDGAHKAVYIPAGVTIPCEMSGLVRYVQVRRLDGKRGQNGKPIRYEKVTGSGRGLYLAEKMRGLPDVFAVEGEFDGLLSWQEFSDLADVVTLGSASGRMDVEWLPFLLSGKRFYVATDDDAGGEAEARQWLELVGKRGMRVLPPGGAKDIDEAWLAGADVRAWAMGCMGSRPTRVRSSDKLEQAALAALNACQRASDSGDSAEAERWADEFDRLAAALWSDVVQLPQLSAR